MKRKLALALAGAVAALVLGGTASAVVVGQGGATGTAPTFVLTGLRTTTAFAVGAWTYSPGTVRVDWWTDCVHPQNDRAGVKFLRSRESALVFTASRSVGTPWLGWDFCRITATYSAAFDRNQDGTAPVSSFSGWLVSHE